MPAKTRSANTRWDMSSKPSGLANVSVTTGGIGPLVPKEMLRARCGERGAVSEGREGGRARPMVGLFDQPVLHRIRQGVDHLVLHVVGVDQANDAGLL